MYIKGKLNGTDNRMPSDKSKKEEEKEEDSTEHGFANRGEKQRTEIMTDEIRIGTSGWSYKEWEGVFYPDSKTPKLTFYSKVFSTAEIDSTFYSNPSRGLALGWSRNTPSNFEFAVKIPKSITHDRQLDLSKGAEIELKKFLELIKPLHDSGKLGPLLIQLPPSFGANKSKILQQFFDALPDGYRFAVEFRNKSWLRDKESVLELLKQYQIANTIVDEPLLPADLTITTSDFAFIRWHGRGKAPWYNYRYSQSEIEPWVEKVKQLSFRVKKVYGYFNNHFHGFAVENGLDFIDKLGLANDQQKKFLEIVRNNIEGRGRRELLEEGKSRLVKEKDESSEQAEEEREKHQKDLSQSSLTQY